MASGSVAAAAVIAASHVVHDSLHVEGLDGISLIVGTVLSEAH